VEYDESIKQGCILQSFSFLLMLNNGGTIGSTLQNLHHFFSLDSVILDNIEKTDENSDH
jgi:hypothetical protein